MNLFPYIVDGDGCDPLVEDTCSVEGEMYVTWVGNRFAMVSSFRSEQEVSVKLCGSFSDMVSPRLRVVTVPVSPVLQVVTFGSCGAMVSPCLPQISGRDRTGLPRPSGRDLSKFIGESKRSMSEDERKR